MQPLPGSTITYILVTTAFQQQAQKDNCYHNSGTHDMRIHTILLAGLDFALSSFKEVAEK